LQKSLVLHAFSFVYLGVEREQRHSQKSERWLRHW